MLAVVDAGRCPANPQLPRPSRRPQPPPHPPGVLLRPMCGSVPTDGVCGWIIRGRAQVKRKHVTFQGPEKKQATVSSARATAGTCFVHATMRDDNGACRVSETHVQLLMHPDSSPSSSPPAGPIVWMYAFDRGCPPLLLCCCSLRPFGV